MQLIALNAWRSTAAEKCGTAELDVFARSLLDWFTVNGRHDLPWQRDVTPYRVWVSEIMLQQTQVRTVIGYFEQFMARFPDIGSLASADVDEVLALWSGLGYYARARNLHRAAAIIADEHARVMPVTHEALTQLPGIGRSTAAAILALSGNQRHPILDGNVKRVLARYHAIEGWPGKTAVSRVLWQRADEHTPNVQVAEYTQAIMDLGATVCVRGEPRCADCPVAQGCEARQAGTARELPTPRKRAERPARQVQLLVVGNSAGEFLLERRPAQGIWGGLLSFPELAVGESAEDWVRQQLGARSVHTATMAKVEHAFSHFDLTMQPVRIDLAGGTPTVMDGDRWLWYKADRPLPGGIAAPIGRILQEVTQAEPDTQELSV